MRVRIGNQWFEATPEAPICVEFESQDEGNLANMTKSSRYAVFHENTALDDAGKRAYVEDGISANT